MARLNAKSQNYSGGRGGRGDMSPQDVAAALSFVPAGLGRELLMRVWWPDGARLTAAGLDKLLADLQAAEWSRREESMLTAVAAVAGSTSRDTHRRAEGLYRDAHAARWPKMVTKMEPLTVAEPYGRIRTAVLAELAGGGLCQVCSGRGTVNNAGKVSDCKTCDGTGTHRASDRSRSEACGLGNHTDYLRAWRPAYEWLFATCQDALSDAERDFCKQLGDAA